MLQILLRPGADPNIVNSHSMTPLQLIGERDMLKHRQALEDSPRDPELCVECARLVLQSLRFDLQKKDKNGPELQGNAASAFTISGVQSPLWTLVAARDPSISKKQSDEIDAASVGLLKLLLAYGFDPNAQPHGRLGPALHLALFNRYLRCAQLLVQAGADITLQVPLRLRVPYSAAEKMASDSIKRSAIGLCEEADDDPRTVDFLEAIARVRSNIVTKQHSALRAARRTRSFVRVCLPRVSVAAHAFALVHTCIVSIH